MFPWFRVINQNKTLSLELFSLVSWLFLLLILLPANRFQVYVVARCWWVGGGVRRNNNKNWHRVAGVAHKILLQNFAGKSAGNIRKMIRAFCECQMRNQCRSCSMPALTHCPTATVPPPSAAASAVLFACCCCCCCCRCCCRLRPHMICISGAAAEVPPSEPHELKLKLKLEHGLRRARSRHTAPKMSKCRRWHRWARCGSGTVHGGRGKGAI